MTDWAPVVVGTVLFALLSPGLLMALPGRDRGVEFGSFKTNGKAVAVHALIFFVLVTVLLVALHLHIYTS